MSLYNGLFTQPIAPVIKYDINEAIDTARSKNQPKLMDLIRTLDYDDLMGYLSCRSTGNRISLFTFNDMIADWYIDRYLNGIKPKFSIFIHDLGNAIAYALLHLKLIDVTGSFIVIMV
jgi:hypothetical protein